MEYLAGVTQMPWWGYVVVVFVFTHITIVSVTVFLHRYQAHRALDLHWLPSNFFRFWLWLTTGMVTKEWTAIHRKHHAKCEKEGDPHSPVVYGIGEVFFRGSELYRAEAKNIATLERYGHGTPDDWMEKNMYTRHSKLGIVLMFFVDVILFGPIGITMWAIQMLWIPVMAAGVINGIGHYLGYRNFETPDESTNIFPWGILIGGEELHNNHHAFSTSAKLSNKWYEFDIGWVYILCMQYLGLAKVKHHHPEFVLVGGKTSCDEKTVRAVIAFRYYVLNKLNTILLSMASYYNGRRLVPDLLNIWGDKSATVGMQVFQLNDLCQKMRDTRIPELVEFATFITKFELKHRRH